MGEDFKRRRRWFDEDKSRFELVAGQAADFKYKCTCPCCGYPTLPQRGLYDICPLCNWEDDDQDDADADKVWGGPNGDYSLTEARANFSRHLIMYDPERPSRRIGGNRDQPLTRQLKQQMIQAFDSMIGVTNRPTLETLWARVREADKLLYEDLCRRIAEYEASVKNK